METVMQLSKLGYLQLMAYKLPEPYQTIVLEVINDPRFQEAPGGREHHHNYKGGLVDHTWEVLNHALDMTAGWGSERDVLIITVAAILHDYLKIFEYGFNEDGTIKSMPYQKRIGHLPGSWEYFMSQARKHDIPDDIRDEISHCMLAHHGRLEWRSPVEPMTKLAHILHAADMLSMQEGKERAKKQHGPVQQS